MISAVPAGFPEPVVSTPTPPQNAFSRDDGARSEFHALLDEQADSELDDVVTEVGDEAEVESGTVASESDEYEAPDREIVVSEAPDGPAPNATEMAVLSSQLAMWQILPPSGEIAVLDGEKIAAPEGVEGMIQTTENVVQRLEENISGVPGGMPSPAPAAADDAVRHATNGEAAGKRGDAGSAPAQQPPASATKPSVAAVAAPSTPMSGKPVDRSVAQVAAEPLGKIHESASGIPVAKEHRDMSDLEFQPTALPETAVLAGQGDRVIPAVEAVSVSTGSGQESPEDSREEPGSQPDSSLASTPVLSPENKLSHMAKASDLPPPVHAADAARTIERIERATEHMRLQADARVEMRVPLQDGSELLVKLHVIGGEVRAHFQTESAGLREALQVGWNQYAAASQERELKVGQAVFESPSMQNSMGGFSQTPDQRSRQQAFADAERSGTTMSVTPSASKPQQAGRPTVAAPSVSSGIQIYA